MKQAQANLAVAVLVVSILQASAQAPVHEPFAKPITAAKIQVAIDDAVQYLRTQQATDGSIGDGGGRDVSGSTALAALTMLAAGKHPGNYAPLRRALDYAMAHDPDGTYARGIRANTWEYALRKLPNDEKIKAVLSKDCVWLQKALAEKEGWRYNLNSNDWDNSVTQYGVLGMWAGMRAGHQPSPAFWRTMAKHFQSCQHETGGWGYQNGHGATANMATAGLATMFLVFDSYFGRTSYSKENPRVFTDGDAALCLASLEKGMNWLGEHGGSVEDSYYLYGIERAGVASGRKYFGGRDWFAEGAIAALSRQAAGGNFGSIGHGNDVVKTAFSTLFLVYGGAPVAFNKLEYGQSQDWNLNPRDLANLSKYMWNAYERPLNWNSVNLSAPASEFEAPILVITGSDSIDFSAEEVAKLREYINRGGMIIAEPSDYSKPFRQSMVKLAEQMFPVESYPQATLAELGADHPIFEVVTDKWNKQPKLHGMSNGSRIVFLLSDDYLCADWQENNTDADAFKLAMNLLFYTIDLGELDGKYATYLPNTPAVPQRDATLSVARVRFNSGENMVHDWDVGKLAWQRYAPYLRHTTGCSLTEVEPVALDPAKIPEANLLHVSGRGRFSLSPEEQTAMKKYVETGGTILVDAYAGSDLFADSAKQQLTAIFGELEPLPNSHELVAGGFSGGNLLTKGIRYKLAGSRALRAADLSTREQHLQVVFHEGRPAVIFSDLDLTSAVSGIRVFECKGYKPDTAMKIVGNLATYLLAER